MPRRPRNPEEVSIGEANVLPVMNIMFLLIPALLLAMEVASMAAVAISPPKTTVAPSPNPEPPDAAKRLELKVFILADGFRVSSAAQQQGADAGKALDSRAPTIPLAKPNAPADDYDRYDYAALGAIAVDFKAAYPSETVVTVSAENDIPAQVLIETMDALRGWDCKLGQLKADQEIPAECMFFRPVIEAGAG
ncbi:ExbD/TolR family protein [Enhygromyxa salina]|uniref:Biopolymer transport protein ExbD/TolR n=1 Tax=Enhygromyxa salina TaxID=215803 RepID=A0A2S9Y0H4_9BACT|nr:biopolymer transporter ExbD [Enhygromyxa salina]PRP98603.1 Biopolymer transport protein ExbD/TolR [Enhygromyxa salina]